MRHPFATIYLATGTLAFIGFEMMLDEI